MNQNDERIDNNNNNTTICHHENSQTLLSNDDIESSCNNNINKNNNDRDKYNSNDDNDLRRKFLSISRHNNDNDFLHNHEITSDDNNSNNNNNNNDDLSSLSIVAHSIDTKSGKVQPSTVEIAISYAIQYQQQQQSKIKTDEEEGVAVAVQNKDENSSSKLSFWIDVEMVQQQQENDVNDHLHEELFIKIYPLLTPFMKRHLTPSKRKRFLETTQVLPLANAALIVLRLLPRSNSNNKGPQHAAALCIGENLLITITTNNTAAMSKTKKKHYHFQQSVRDLNIDIDDDVDIKTIIEEQELPRASTTGALAVWLSIHLNQVAMAVQSLRTRIFHMNEQMDSNGIESISLSDITFCKDQLLILLSIAEEQLECIEALQNADSLSKALDFTKLNAFLTSLISIAGSTERSATRLEKRLFDIRQSYDSYQQDKINRRLALLTILSAIFLPLTLMAGIWGMNFTNMPELQRENGYYAAITSMIVVAVTLLLIFYRYGWFS